MPVILHPEPARALVIGLGGGATAGAVSLHPDLAVDIVELASGVVRRARSGSRTSTKTSCPGRTSACTWTTLAITCYSGAASTT